jgi:hypothetical protein
MTGSCMCKRQKSGQKSRSKGSKRVSLRDAALALVKRRKRTMTGISLAEEEGDLIHQDLLKGGRDEIRKERGADILVQVRDRIDIKIGRGGRPHLHILLLHQATAVNHKTQRNHQIWND